MSIEIRVQVVKHSLCNETIKVTFMIRGLNENTYFYKHFSSPIAKDYPVGKILRMGEI